MGIVVLILLCGYLLVIIAFSIQSGKLRATQEMNRQLLEMLPDAEIPKRSPDLPLLPKRTKPWWRYFSIGPSR